MNAEQSDEMDEAFRAVEELYEEESWFAERLGDTRLHDIAWRSQQIPA